MHVEIADVGARGVVDAHAAAVECLCQARQHRLDLGLAAIEELAAKVRIGNPAEPTVTLGPLISAAQRDKVERFVASGLNDGASLVTGGKRPDIPRGFYYEPTILADVDNSWEVARREIFGPVGVVIDFDTDQTTEEGTP